jgi:hypothetical protein
MLEVRILPGEPAPLSFNQLRTFQEIRPFDDPMLVRESRLIAINKDERKSTAAGVSAFCQINRGESRSNQAFGSQPKYFQTAVEEEMIKKGAATYWAADEDYIPIRDTSMRYMVSIYPDAEALDKWAAVQASVLRKMGPEDLRAWQEGNSNTMVTDSPRSFHFLARITHYAHK